MTERKRPSLLIVGGEERNFGSKRFRELFEITIVEKDKKKIPIFRDKKFDAVAILRFVNKSMIHEAKRWADAHGIGCVEAYSVGRIPTLLAQRVPRIREYLEFVEREKKEKASEPTSLPEPDPVPDPISQSSLALSDDDLWGKYGSFTVQSIHDATKEGEEFSKSWFMTFFEEVTGLPEEDALRLYSMLQIRGVLSEIGDRVIIGTVNPVNVERRKAFINQAAKGAPEKERGSVPEVFKRIEPFLKDGSRYPTVEHMIRSLTSTFLKPNGSKYSREGLRLIVNKLKKAGCIEFEFLEESGDAILRVHRNPVPVEEEVPSQGEQEPVEEEQEETVVVVEEPRHASTPSPEKERKTEVAKPQEPPSSLPTSLHDTVAKTYSGGRIPWLMSLKTASYVLRSFIRSTVFFDEAAARTIVLRLRISEDLIPEVLKRRPEFTDDQWGYLALEFLRDQPMGTIFPILVQPIGLWHSCMKCKNDFFSSPHKYCRPCANEYRTEREAHETEGKEVIKSGLEDRAGSGNPSENEG